MTITLAIWSIPLVLAFFVAVVGLLYCRATDDTSGTGFDVDLRPLIVIAASAMLGIGMFIERHL